MITGEQETTELSGLLQKLRKWKGESLYERKNGKDWKRGKRSNQ